MRIVWKYQFEIKNRFSLPLAPTARVVLAELQGVKPTLWALTDDDQPLSLRWFRIYGTGQSVPDDAGAHVASFQDGSFVWHLFEEPR